MIFNTWDQRVDFLEHIKWAVVDKFPQTDTYNIFVFGSFLRTDYDPLRSDLDLAIYSRDTNLTFQICDFLDEYLNQCEVPHSLLEIFLDQLDAYVAVKPLSLNVSFTDYYPEELAIYRRTVQRRAIFYNAEAEHIEKVRKAMMESA